MKCLNKDTYTLESLEVYKAELEAQNIELLEKEAELKDRSLENETLFFHAPIPYLLINEKCNILKCNKLAEEMFHFNAFSQMKTQMISSYFKNENLSMFLNWINNRDFIQTSINLEIVIKNKKEIFKVQADEYAHDKNLIMLSMFSIQKEIDLFEATQKKDKLIQSQSKMALLGEMLNNISHQWRQPLSTMTIAASGIKLKHEMNALDENTLVEFVDAILSNSKYLSKTIDDFRDLALNEYESKNFDIKVSVEKTLSIFKSKLIDSDITIVNDVTSKLYFGSQSQLMQVFINIISNSIDEFKDKKNKKDKKKIIHIKISEVENSHQIEFCDNAGGISPAIIEKVFEPYFTTKNNCVGTGIGLYMSFKIITEQFNGKISCSNKTMDIEENKESGASFVVSLPAK